MTPEEILDTPARILTQSQREYYFEQGYLILPGIIPDAWLNKLRSANDELIERSKNRHRQSDVSLVY